MWCPNPRTRASKHAPASPSVTKTTDVASTLAGGSPTAQPEAQRPHRGSMAAAGTHVDWATVLRRVFDVDSLQCPRCGGRPRVITTITEESAVTKILDSVGLASSPTLPHARSRPTTELRPGAVRGVVVARGPAPGSSLRRSAATHRCVLRSPSPTARGWFRPLRPIALATDVVEVRLDLREAFEFPIGPIPARLPPGDGSTYG
jgi:hypothetical protein